MVDTNAFTTPHNKRAGELGEDEVIKLVRCPNCGKRLEKLPPNYPMYDVQCTGCYFRAQVKTNNTKPRDQIFGAGWEIVQKVLKVGYPVPPLIVNFKWQENGVIHQTILFYPFIPRTKLKKVELRDGTGLRFNYKGLNSLPCLVLYEEPKPAR